MTTPRLYVIACCAAMIGGLASAQQLSGHDVTIWNSTTTAVSFQLSDDGERWNAFSLKPDAQETYQSNGQLLVRMATGPQAPSKSNDDESEVVSVAYRLTEKERYKLFWNKKSKRWDVARMKPRK
jgi:hypothetical protein